MATNANEILDRLDSWLDKTKSGPLFHSDNRLSAWDLDTYLLLRRAAPALIRLARAAANLADDPRYEYGRVEFNDAVKALGEVRL